MSMGSTSDDTTLALLVTAVILFACAILYCLFKDLYGCLTCPLRCIGKTYQRCCPTSAGYKVSSGQS